MFFRHKPRPVESDLSEDDMNLFAKIAEQQQTTTTCLAGLQRRVGPIAIWFRAQDGWGREQNQYQSPSGFLFGVGLMPNSGMADISYESIFLDKASDFTAPFDEEDGNKTTTKTSSRPRASLFNFIAPFARYFAAIACGNMLIKAAKLIPTILPSPTHLKTIYLTIAGTILMLDFISLALRPFEWFPSAAPFLNPTKRCGRNIMRRFGKTLWKIWYLSQPARLLITTTACIVVLGLFVLASHSIHLDGATTSSAPLIQVLKWACLLLAMTHMSWAFLNFMADKPWVKQGIAAVFFFSIGTIASLAIGIATTGAEPPPFLTP